MQFNPRTVLSFHCTTWIYKGYWRHIRSHYSVSSLVSNVPMNLMYDLYDIIIVFNTVIKGGGVPLDSKISFWASAQKRRISWHCCFLTLTCLPPRIFWHVFEKKKKMRRALCSNCVRVTMDHPLTTNGTRLDKTNFPHTRDLWPLVAMHKGGLMILSHINAN